MPVPYTFSKNTTGEKIITYRFKNHTLIYCGKSKQSIIVYLKLINMRQAWYIVLSSV